MLLSSRNGYEVNVTRKEITVRKKSVGTIANIPLGLIQIINSNKEKDDKTEIERKRESNR